MEQDGKKGGVALEIDPTRKPKEIDLIQERVGKVRTTKGIYTLDRNELKICAGRGDSDRPTEFATKEGMGVSIMTL